MKEPCIVFFKKKDYRQEVLGFGLIDPNYVVTEHFDRLYKAKVDSVPDVYSLERNGNRYDILALGKIIEDHYEIVEFDWRNPGVAPE